MTSPIDPSQRIARLVALLSPSERAGASTAGTANSFAPAPGQAAAILLRAQLKAIAPDHPRLRRARSRVLVENLLGEGFGSEALNDPAFQLLVDDVLETMDGDPTLSAHMTQLVDRLLE